MQHDTLVQMLETHAPMLRVLAHQMAGDSHEAEDLVQDTFLALAKLAKAPDFPKTWLWRTLRNIALTNRRGLFRRQNRERANIRDSALTQSLDEDLIRNESLDRLKDCLNLLTREDRELLAAILWGNLSFADAAEVLGGSASHLHRRYHGILERLRALMGEEKHATQRS